MHQNKIATFTGDVFSSPSGIKLNYRFHDVDNGASGSWSSTQSLITTPIPTTQTIQAEIFKCVSGAPSTTLVSGGSITVPAAGLSSANPLPATQVDAGTYTVNATAPSGQMFVACGQSGVTITAPGSANQSVTVPSGGAGDGKFYVKAIPSSQTVQAEIFKCVSGAPTTTLVTGGSITVPAAGLSSANPLPATQVAAGTYTVNATAPSGQMFVACGQSGVTITAPGSANQSVTVPSGGAGDGKFYVKAIPSSQTVQAEIFKCVSGAPSTTLVTGGSITVPAAGLSSASPLPATQVAAGTYTVNATAPSGQMFVACGQSGVTITAPGSANQSVTVPSGGAGDGKFYVKAIQTGFVEICKSSANGVTGNFTFTANAQTFTIPAGTCTPAIEVPVGNLKVKEQASAFYSMVSASAQPSTRLVSVDVANQNATVQIVAGGISTQTILTFVNGPAQGTIKICQVAGTGIAVGTPFTFTNSSSGQTVQVPAGPAPGGYCVILDGTFSGTVTITQQVPLGAKVSAVKVAPFNRLVGTPDKPHGQVTIQVGTGVTEVTYTDVSAPY